jgi:hypothetical protein
MIALMAAYPCVETRDCPASAQQSSGVCGVARASSRQKMMRAGAVRAKRPKLDIKYQEIRAER